MRVFPLFLSSCAPSIVRPVVLVALSLSPFEQAASQPTVRYVGDSAVSPYGFTAISSVFRLSTGAFIVHDRRELTVYVVPRTGGNPTRAIRTGSGPGEARLATRIFEIGSGRIGVNDAPNARIVVIAPDGLVETNAAALRAVNARWNAIQRETGHIARDGTISYVRTDDEGVQVVARARANQRDTALTTLSFSGSTGRSSRPVVERAATSVGVERARNIPAMRSDDWFASGDDGWSVVVRAKPYRVEWIRPDDRLVIGGAVRVSRIRVDEPTKAAFTSMLGRQSGRPPRSPAEFAFPDFLPAIFTEPDQGVFVAPDGRAWVRRAVLASSAPAWDVFDRAGNLVERAVLPNRSRVVGFVGGLPILAITDADELEVVWLAKKS